MKPQVIATLVLVSLAAVSFALIGIGGHGGALSPASLVLQQTSDGYPDLQMGVALSGFAAPSGYYVSAYLPNGSSSPISIGVNIWTNASTSAYCDSAGKGSAGAGWAAGSGKSYAYYIVSVTSSSGSVEPIGQAGGPNYLTVSENGSAVQWAYCLTGVYTSGGTFSTGSGFATDFPGTVYLPGNYTDNSVLHVDFFTQESQCVNVLAGVSGVTGITPDSVCTTASSHASSFAGSSGSIGTRAVHASGQAILHSGFNQLFPPKENPVVNGGTLTIPYTTGWTDGSGFAIQFNTPSARGASSTLATTQVPDNSVSSVQFSVPSTASQTPPGACANGNKYCSWNQYTVVLFSDKFAEAVQSINVLIYPNSGANNVQISAVDSSGHSPIVQGDTVTLTVSATATNASGIITSITLSGYWNLGESTPPVNSQFWLFNNPSGKVLTLSTTGNVSSGSTAVQMGTVAPLTVIAQVCTAKAQCNDTVLTLNVVPANCANSNFCKGPATFDQLWGTLLLALGVTSLTLIAVVWLPGRARYAAILAVVAEGVAFALFWGAIGGLFA